MFEAFKPIEGLGLHLAAIKPLGHCSNKRVINQRGLSTAGDSGYTHHKAQGHPEVDRLQVVAARPKNLKPTLAGLASFGRKRNGQPAREVIARQ